jgi:hypothetical protein
VIVVGGWFTYAAKVPHEGAASYGRDLADASGGVEGTKLVTKTVERALLTGYVLSTRTTIQTMALPTVQDTIIDNLVWCAVIFVLVPIGIFVLWKSWRAMALYLILYCGLLVAWPYSAYRVFSVILPALTLAMFIGAKTVADRYAPRATHWVFAVLTVLLVVGATRQNMGRYKTWATCDRDNPHAVGGCHTPVENTMIKAAEVISTQGGPDDLIVTSKGATMHFLTNRKTVPSRSLHGYGSAVVDTLRARGIRYVLLAVLIGWEEAPLAASIQPRCNEMRLEVSDLPYGVLLSVLPPGETAPEACAAIPGVGRRPDAPPTN